MEFQKTEDDKQMGRLAQYFHRVLTEADVHGVHLSKSLLGFQLPAPKGASEVKEVAASLKRWPDTKQGGPDEIRATANRISEFGLTKQQFEAENLAF